MPDRSQVVSSPPLESHKAWLTVGPEVNSPLVLRFFFFFSGVGSSFSIQVSEAGSVALVPRPTKNDADLQQGL